MTQRFFTIITDVGAAADANAKALGQNLQLTHFAVGDGGGSDFNPDVETLKQTNSLVNEVHRGAINELKIDPTNPARYYAEGVVPVSVGGWTVREAGWFLSDGTLYAVTKFPPSYKSIPSDGAATELPVRTYIATGSTDTVELKIDPTVVLATRQYVDNFYQILDTRYGLKPLSLNNQTEASHTYLFDEPNLTGVLPNIEGLAPYVTVKFKRSLGVQNGTLVPFDFNEANPVTNLIIEDTDGVLHTDTEIIYSTAEPITATLNKNRDWEITRGS